ncbi:MAG: GFA family protein [Devosia sp.]|mgnify:CR=1 FL=1|uniref:GFA family protein n=1 Tax=unclassified Devosia TaxID=196773 RepID=UPI00092936C2|nr:MULTISPECIES: GFA family protein [unclassified Devosia]MBL8599396.1 GFA family protein [Devosia sp.]MBN9347950.1 GFA family protein [Devosia sp.]OJX51521.1 MAG: aldehyde-activating protein [Devosia sp. 66-22]
MAGEITGGCQCGAVRFSVERLGRASICHCRMCQKAFGGFYGPLVGGHGLAWTRGAPAWFQSSNKVRRGFCAQCGTPLAYDYGGATVEVAIGALDDPELAAPAIQVNPADKLSFVDGLPDLPMQRRGENPNSDAFMTGIVSHQHPDHDTVQWPPAGGFVA